MCTCKNDNINGEPGIDSETGQIRTYPLRRPAIPPHEEEYRYLPGRCQKGLLDAHCSDMLITKAWCGGDRYTLYARGQRYDLGLLGNRLIDLDFWKLLSVVGALENNTNAVAARVNGDWNIAARDGRLKIGVRRGVRYARIDPIVIETETRL